MSFFNLRSPFFRNPLATPPVDVNIPSAAISGTITNSITETDIVTGGNTIIITLTNDTWVANGAIFDAIRQDIINGLDSAQAEATGWNAVVQAGQGVTGVVRTSDTIITVTLNAFATYNITATETITVTVPASAVTSASTITGSPTFDITATSGSGGGFSWPTFTGNKFWSPYFS